MKNEVIINKILECEAAQFQRVCDSYFRENGFPNIKSYGLTKKGNKTKKGTPDSHSINEQGVYTFFEYTTEQENIGKKLNADVDKCLELIEKTNNDEQNKNIICGKIVFVAASNNLDSISENNATKKCEEKGIKLIVICLNQLCDMLRKKGRMIIEEEFKITINYSPVCTLDEFIKRNSNNCGSDFSKKMFGRENDLKNISEKLQSNDAIIVSGESGVGKTKLVIEYLKTVKEKTLVVQNRSGDIAHDLLMEISENEKCIIFFDDANGMPQLKQVMEDIFISSNNSKIVISVRNYARGTINRILSQFNIKYTEHLINSLESSEINSIIEKNYGITNYKQRDRIIEIAKGNARVAVLACEKVLKDKNCIFLWDDSAALLSDYYSDVIDSNKIDYVNNKKILCILATIKKIDLKNCDLMKIICSSIGIEQNELYNRISDLYSLEIVDIYLDRVVQISDQCLQDYFIYDGYVKSKFLPFKKIVKDFFNIFRIKIVESINVLVNVYTSKKGNDFIKEELISLWNELEKENKIDVNFISAFSLLDSNRAIKWVENRIFKNKTKYKWEYNSIEKEYYSSDSDEYLEILESIFSFELDCYSLSLIYESLKYKELRKKTIEIIKRTVSFQVEDFENNFMRQYKMIDVLLELKEEEYFNDIAAIIAKELLKFNYSISRKGKGMTIEYCYFSINDEMVNCFELRNRIWKLLNFVESSKLFDTIYNYFDNYLENAKALFLNDIANLESIMCEHHFNRNKEILIFAKSNSMFSEIKSSWKKMYEKYKEEINDIVLLFDLEESEDKDLTYIEGKSQWELDIQKSAETDSLDKGKNRLLDVVAMFKISKYYKLSSFVEYYLRYCSTKIIDWVLNRIEEFVDCFGALMICSVGKRIAIDNYFETKISTIESQYLRNEFKAYYINYSEGDNELLKKYFKEMISFDFADEKYTPLVHRRLDSIYRLFSDKKEFCSFIEFVNQNKARCKYLCENYYSELFNQHVFSIEKLIDIFSDNLSILESAFINHLPSKNFAYKASTYYFTICDHDSNFFDSSIEFILSTDAHLSAIKRIWQQNNRNIYASKIFDCLWNKIDTNYHVSLSFAEYFGLGNRAEYKDNNAILEWSKMMIDTNKDLRKYKYLTKIVVETDKRCLVDFLSYLINKKEISEELFESLPTEPFIISYSGSRVPLIEKEIAFYNELLKAIENKFKQRKIVSIITERINKLEKSIPEIKVEENFRFDL